MRPTRPTPLHRSLTAAVVLALPWAVSAAEPTATPAPAVGAELPGIALPAMETRPAKPVIADTNEGAAKPAPVPEVPSKQTLTLTPGVNQVIPIARGHLNRIVTPFAEPTVHTTSSAQISTEGAVLYVASKSESPSTLYVSPGGQKGMALSITLLPRSIPPREVRLRIAGHDGEAYINRVRAGEWERARAYVRTIKAAMRRLALGEVPPGYGLREWRTGDPALACAQRALRVEAEQVLSGAELILVVGVATNTSDERVELREATCRRSGVLAVAAWPQASLAPGTSTEIYQVVRRPAPERDARERPSLIADEGASRHE